MRCGVRLPFSVVASKPFPTVARIPIWRNLAPWWTTWIISLWDITQPQQATADRFLSWGHSAADAVVDTLTHFATSPAISPHIPSYIKQFVLSYSYHTQYPINPEMRSSVLLPQFFLPPSAITLGRFVTNIDEPHRDYLDPRPGKDFRIIEKIATQYDGTDSLRAQRKFGSELTAFLSSTVSSRTNASIHIKTKQVKTYYLDNNGQWFRDIVKLEDVRKWVERTIDEGEDIYVVVGYHTVLDARIAEQSREQKLLDGNLAVPVSSALLASGVVVPFGELVDPRLAGSSGQAEDLQRQFVAQGEQIIAVQYRKVRFRFFSSKSVDNATLAKGARWERYDRPRYLQSDMEDMVEVALDDDLSLEGDRDKYIAGSEETIFSNVGVDFV